MDFVTMLSAVLTANLFTALFIWGIMRAFHIRSGNAAPMAVVGAITVPLFIIAAGAYLAR